MRLRSRLSSSRLLAGPPIGVLVGTGGLSIGKSRWYMCLELRLSICFKKAGKVVKIFDQNYELIAV